MADLTLTHRATSAVAGHARVRPTISRIRTPKHPPRARLTVVRPARKSAPKLAVVTTLDDASDADDASTAPAAAPHWTTALGRRALGFFIHITYAVIFSISIALVVARTVTVVRTEHLAAASDELQLLALVAVAVFVCAAPYALTLGFAAMMRDLHPSPQRYDLETSSPTTGDDPTLATQQAKYYQAAYLVWRHELLQTDHRRSRLMQYAHLYALVTSVLWAASAALLCRYLLVPAPQQGTFGPVYATAAALAAACAVGFAFDLGRMLDRASRRDNSAQMFAWSTRRMLLIAIGTVALAAITSLDPTGDAPALTVRAALALGTAVALLGERVVGFVVERIATLFGMTALMPKPKDDLAELEGLTANESARLAEEGIDSLHALAFFSTAKLFFNTPFSLKRICAWQDRALFIVRLRPEVATLLRDQFGVCGAIGAQRFALRLLNGELSETQRNDVIKILGFASAEQAIATLEEVAFDQSATLVSIYQTASPTAQT